jgi:hypothetical protein
LFDLGRDIKISVSFVQTMLERNASPILHLVSSCLGKISRNFSIRVPATNFAMGELSMRIEPAIRLLNPFGGAFDLFGPSGRGRTWGSSPSIIAQTESILSSTSKNSHMI